MAKSSSNSSSQNRSSPSGAGRLLLSAALSTGDEDEHGGDDDDDEWVIDDFEGGQDSKEEDVERWHLVSPTASPLAAAAGGTAGMAGFAGAAGLAGLVGAIANKRPEFGAPKSSPPPPPVALREVSARSERSEQPWEDLGVDALAGLMDERGERRPPPLLGAAYGAPASLLLTRTDAARVEDALPAVYQGQAWRLAYRMADHGSSLRTLLGRCRPGRPAVLLVQDTSGSLFGCFTPAGWRDTRDRRAFYGDPDTFAFTLAPAWGGAYRWSGADRFFQSSTEQSLALGGGPFALFMDEGLSKGSSAPCPTFRSPSLSASGGEEFRVAACEVYELTPRRASAGIE